LGWLVNIVAVGFIGTATTSVWCTRKVRPRTDRLGEISSTMGWTVPL